MRYVSRIDSGKTRGWFLRVAGQPGELYSDSAFGGKDDALAMALARRDLLASRTPYEPIRGCRANRRNTSGVVGVQRVVRRQTGKPTYEAWVASWMSAGRQVKRCFGVVRMGEEKAFAAAVRCREQNVGIHRKNLEKKERLERYAGKGAA